MVETCRFVLHRTQEQLHCISEALVRAPHYLHGRRDDSASRVHDEVHDHFTLNAILPQVIGIAK